MNQTDLGIAREKMKQDFRLALATVLDRMITHRANVEETLDNIIEYSENYHKAIR